MTGMREKYGQTYRMWLGPQLWIFLHSAEETKDALNDLSLIKADTFNQLDMLIGNGLLISHGKVWDSHRKMLGPAFHPSILSTFPLTIEQHVRVLCQKLQSTAGQTVEVSEYLFPCILDAIIGMLPHKYDKLNIIVLK